MPPIGKPVTYTIALQASFIDVAHADNDADIAFFRSLPHVQFQWRNAETGVPEQPIPGPKQTLLTLVTAIISSTALSQGIEAWLKKAPTRIEVTVEEKGHKRSVVFEGPNIKESREDIDRLIRELSPELDQCTMRVDATKKRAPPT